MEHTEGVRQRLKSAPSATVTGGTATPGTDHHSSFSGGRKNSARLPRGPISGSRGQAAKNKREFFFWLPSLWTSAEQSRAEQLFPEKLTQK